MRWQASRQHPYIHCEEQKQVAEQWFAQPPINQTFPARFNSKQLQVVFSYE
jgi:hypothetical protein